MVTRRARRIETWIARSVGLLATLAFGAAVAAPPAEFSTSYAGDRCTDCHAAGPNQPPFLPPTSQIVPNGAAAGSGAGVRTLMSAIGSMDNIRSSPALTDAVLDTIWLYLVAVRDGTVVPAASTDFGSAAVSAAGSTHLFTITNERDVAATFASGPSGSNAEFARVGGTCAASIAAGASCSVNMQFTPSGIGARSGFLRFTLDSPAGITAVQRSVALTGTGTPQFDISAATLNFGSVTATTTAVRSAIIRNIGGASFSLGTLTFSGASAALYSLAPTNACTAGLSLAGGAQCQLDVRFAPLVAGAGLNASLSITHGGGGSPQVVTLLGAATPAPQGLIELSALSLAFPDTQLGSNTPLSITVRNIGDATLNLSAITPGGAVPGDFLRSGTCNVGAALAIGAQCTLTVTFQPTALGARSASLTIQSDASNGPATIALAGTGVPVPAPQASLLPAPLDFGVQTIGGLYPKRTITLKNVGTANMSVSAIAVQGAAFANVSAAVCPTTLVPGASCDIDLAFTPIAAATDYTGTLSVTTDAPGSPHTAALLGRGTAATVPVLAWAPAIIRLDFGLVTAGTVSAVQSATLVNNGPGGAIVNLVNAVGVDASAFSVAGGTCVVGMTLFQGDTCRVDVQFAPAFAGDRSAAVQVASTGSFPPALALVGTGLAGPSPGLTLSVTALQFGDTRVGAQSVPLEVTLSGTGSGVVRVTALDINGPYAVQNKTCPSVPFVLQAGGACTVTVSFLPQAEGSASGSLSVTSDATPATGNVALSGTGEPKPDLSSGGCSLSSGDSLADPTLWALMALAVAALFYRRRARRPPGSNRRERP